MTTTKYIVTYKNTKTGEFTYDSAGFDIKDSDYKSKLYYSEDANWTAKVKGRKGASLYRKGDNVVLKIENKKKIVLDYGQLEMLLILLTHNNNTDTFKTIIGKIQNVD